jgi:polyhydroxyalkanoate synthesis regulator phasin
MNRVLSIIGLSALMLLLVVSAAGAQDAQPTLWPTAVIAAEPVVTNTEPVTTSEVTVLPESLGRLSWGAVLAGALIAFIIQIALNLLAIGIGMNKINPERGRDSADAKSLGVGAVAAMFVSLIVSLLVGGYLAARFAGIPDEVDGVLHGLLVWGVVTLVTVFLITTTIGRLISGFSSLLGEGLRLAGAATGAVASGAANVAQGVVSTAASAVQSAGGAVAEKAQDALEDGARASNGRGGSNGADIFSIIKDEAMQLMRDAGIQPEQVQAEVANAGGDLQGAAKAAVQRPEEIGPILTDALNRVFQRGQQVVGQADRQSLVDVLVQRGHLTEQQANETVTRWERQAEQARTQADQTVQQAKERAQDVGEQVQRKADEAKHEAERVAREAAQKTTDALAKLALAAFFAIVVGAVAAGLGGLVGAPEVLPTAQVETTTDVVQ